MWKCSLSIIAYLFFLNPLASQSISIIKPYVNQKINTGEEIEIQWVNNGYKGKLMISYSVSSESFEIFTVNVVEGSAYWIVPPITGDDVHIIIQLQSSPYTLTTVPVQISNNENNSVSKPPVPPVSFNLNARLSGINYYITWNNPTKESCIIYWGLSEKKWNNIIETNKDRYLWIVPSQIDLNNKTFFIKIVYKNYTSIQDIISISGKITSTQSSTISNNTPHLTKPSEKLNLNVVRNSRSVILKWMNPNQIRYKIYYQRMTEYNWHYVGVSASTTYNFQLPTQLSNKPIWLRIVNENLPSDNDIKFASRNER